MVAPRQFKLADFGDEPEDIGSFCVAEVEWSKPAEWSEDDKAPVAGAMRKEALYVIVRDHGRQLRTNQLVYVGMTTSLPTRFNQHHRADEIRAKRGLTRLSIGTVDFSGASSRWAQQNLRDSLEQLEHLLIWALWPTLLNTKNQYSLPLLGGPKIAHAKPWIVRNVGYRFSGRMPREIIYPWMAVKLGRDRSAKK